MKRIKLAVPFAEKDVVKSLGAKWDREAKTWYIETKDPERWGRHPRPGEEIAPADIAHLWIDRKADSSLAFYVSLWYGFMMRYRARLPAEVLQTETASAFLANSLLMVISSMGKQTPKESKKLSER
jgi:hypothetical protein